MKSTRHRLAALLVLLSVAAVSAGGIASAGEPPLADAGLDQQVDQNATVLLDAAGSRDPDGTIQSYRWTIQTPNGRSVRPSDPDAPRTTFVARQPGRYEVRVTVTDDDGQSTSDTLYVDVEATDDGPPASQTPSDGTDTTPGLPDATATAADGVTDPATPDAPLPATSGNASAVGSPENDCPPDTTRVAWVGCLAGDPPATVDIEGERYVRQGSVHTYTATVRDHPSGDERLSWSGGLGTGNTLTRVFTRPPGSTVTISATVEDGEGHTTSDTFTVHVITDNAPPEVRIEGPTATCVGEPVELEGYAVSSDDHDRVTDATWHGDPTFVPQHPGQYEVGFSARDRQGQTARTSRTVTVRAERVCNPSKTESPTGEGDGQDKLLIRANDDNWVEGRDLSRVMRARGNVPESSPVETLSDIGASLGKAGEGAAEHATGNRETLVFYMSAENASRVEESIQSTPTDEVVAGANGPRINEHERLRKARVEDQVETSGERVKVVVRIGRDNSGNPDKFETEAGSQTQRTNGAGTEPTSSSVSETPSESESTEELASASEQKTITDSSGPAELVSAAADSATDTINAVSDARNNLLSSKDEGDSSQDDTSETNPDRDRTGGSLQDESTGPSESTIGTIDSRDSSGSAEVPPLRGMVDTAFSGSDGVGQDSSDSDSSGSGDEPIIDGSGSWGGII